MKQVINKYVSTQLIINVILKCTHSSTASVRTCEESRRNVFMTCSEAILTEGEGSFKTLVISDGFWHIKGGQ